MAVTKLQKAEILKKFKTSELDTGSPEVQVALLTAKINELTGHFATHKKDNHSRRGLIQMVADRRKHLNYLKSNFEKRYKEVAKKFDLK